MLLTQAHKLPWALSQILPIIAHMLSNLGSHKKYLSYYYQNWAAKLYFSHTKPNIIWLVGKTQRKPKIPKSAMMRHYLQSSLLHGNTLQNLKIISTKPKFLFGIYFSKTQNLIWHYFIKPKILFWQLFLHSFIKPKY